MEINIYCTDSGLNQEGCPLTSHEGFINMAKVDSLLGEKQWKEETPACFGFIDRYSASSSLYIIVCN